MAQDGHEALQLLVRGFQVSRLLRLVAELGLADRIPAEGSRSLHALAAEVQVLPQPLQRVLRALTAFGVFRVGADGSVGHTALSLPLRRDAPDSQHHAALVVAGRGSWQAWNELDAALHGELPHQRAWGCSRFEYLRAHPAEARAFDLLMSQGAADRHRTVAAAYDFEAADHIVDVGGGDGGLLRAVLACTRRPRGLVYDRAEVVAAASGEAPRRLSFEAGDFFERVPAEADLYLLSRVLHDWPDEAALRILANCRQAMRPESRLLVIEMLLPADPAQASRLEALSDVQMLAMFGEGRERSLSEYGALLQRAGFGAPECLPVAGAVAILESRPR